MRTALAKQGAELTDRMNPVDTVTVLCATYAAVFGETSFNTPRDLLGAQIDLLPAIIAYTSLSAGPGTLALISTCGGLWHDSLSANPLGVSVLPLLATGLLLNRNRDIVVREAAYAQFILGFVMSALVPVLTLILVINTGARPLISLDSLWQWLVMALGGGIATPLLFPLFDRLHKAFSYQHAHEATFRSDREIKRGRR